MLNIELRPYQQDAVNSIYLDLSLYNKIGAVLPTGSGKTEILIALADRFLRDNPSKSVLYLSHLDILTSQTYERFKVRTPHLSVGILQGSQSPSPMNNVVISTMQTARSQKHFRRLENTLMFSVGLIFVDEAHFLYTESYDLTLSHFPNVKIVGVTATPFRCRALMTGFFDKVSYSISLQELIDQGYLVPPVMTQIIKRGNTLPDIIGLTVNLYKQNESGKKAIVYMQQIEDCKLLRNAFQAAGVKCRAITSELTGEARDAVLMSFSKGSTQVLTTVNVLTAGFDSPNIEAIFQPYATSSPTQYLQRIGRGLRLCPEINKKHCNVYVYGDSPSISRQLYIKLQTRLLNAGGKIREFPTYEENLEYNEYDKGSEIYNWTSQIVHVVQHMRKMGMHSLADKLNHKDFPPKFLKDLSLFVKNLPKHKGNVGSAKTPITNKQLQVLVNNGFDNDYASSLTKNEASGMISTIFNMYNVKSDFIIPDGMHQGKHISELPFAYRRVILTKFPNSNVAKMLRQFYERKNNDQNHQR